MPEYIKTLIPVLVLAVPAFYVGRQLAGALMMQREFTNLRNLWFVVTIAAFLFGNAFLYAGALILVCIYARAARIANLGLFFVLLLAAPLVTMAISGFDIVNRLVDLTHAHVLFVFLLLPILLASGGGGNQRAGGFSAPDFLIVAYVVLMVVLNSRDAEITHALRLATQYTLSTLIPYFAFSRAVTGAADIRKVYLGFVVAALPFALIVAFEMLKGWRLYGVVFAQWGNDFGGYLLRDGMLRGSATASSPIVAGYVLMVAIGCLLALWRPNMSRQIGGAALGILGAGLIATLSRGPWVGTVFLVLVYLATGPNAAANLGRLAIVGIMALFVLPLTSFGARILDFLPFIGTVEHETLEYRKSLFETSWLVIQQNLWFGSTDYRQAPEMQELMQGVGMIDIVNHYIKIALDAGVAGLILFLGFFGSILIGLRRVLKLSAPQDSDFRGYVRATMAILVAILVTIATASSIEYIPIIYMTFGGLGVALIRIAHRERAAARHAVRARQVPV
jgi:hypothetical protein